MSTEKFSAIFDLNIDGFQKGISNAQKNLDKFDKKMSSVGKSLSKGLTAPLAAVTGAATLLVKNFADVGDSIDKASQRAGVSAESFQELEFALGQFGVSAEESGRAIERLNQRKSRAVQGNEQLSKAFANLGIELKDVNGNVKDTDSLFDETITRLSQFEDSSEAAAAGGEIFGQRLIRRLIPAINGGGDALEELRREAQETGIIMSGENVQAAADFTDKLDVLTRRFSILGANIGASFMPIIERLMNFVSSEIVPIFISFGDKIQKLISFYDNLDDKTKTIIGSFVGFAAAIGPALLAVGKFSGLISGLLGIFAGLSAPIIAVGAAIAGAAFLIVNNWDKVTAYFSSGPGLEMFETLKSAATQLFDTLKEVFTTIYNIIVDVWEAVGDDVITYVTNLFNGIVGVFTKLFNYINNFLKDVQHLFSNGFGSVFDVVKSIFSRMAQLVVGVLSEIAQLVSKNIGQIVSIFDKDMGAAIMGFVDNIAGAENQINGFLDSFVIKHQEATEATNKQAESLEVANQKTRERTDFLNLETQAQNANNEAVNNSLSTYDGYIEKLETAANQSIALGSNFDQVASAISITETAIKQMIEQGVSPFDERIIEMRNNLELLQGSVAKVGEEGESFSKNFQGNMEETAASMAKQSASVDEMAKNMVGSLLDSAAAGLISSIMASVPFPVNIALAAGAGAIIGGLKSNLPELASGGIIGSEMNVKVGEYIGAKNNPEIIAPINKLENMMGGSNVGVATGENVIFSMEHTNKRFNRMGN